MIAAGTGVNGSRIDNPPYLGVEKSVTGRRWQGLTANQDRLSLQIAQRCNLPSELSRALARRNLRPWEVSSYLNPYPIDLLAAHQDLPDLERAAERLAIALEGGQKLAVVASSGIDGCCALQMVRQTLATAPPGWQKNVTWHYRSSILHDNPCIQLAATNDLVILLDHGTIERQLNDRDCRADMIIIDNDVSDCGLPAVHAIVNGNRFDGTGRLTDLCTAGLVYLLLASVNRIIASNDSPAMDLGNLEELICLACASERVSLAGNNRAFVTLGLQQLRKRGHPGLRAIADAIPLRQMVAYHDLRTGFVPRLELGTVGDGDPVIARILGAANVMQASGYAEVLNDFHGDGLPDLERFKLEAIEMASTRKHATGLVWAASREWPVTRLEPIASALQEHFNWPAIAMRMDVSHATGAAVGIPGFDFGVAISNCRHEGFDIIGGGHQMKAFIAIPTDKVTSVVELLGRYLYGQKPFHDATHDVRLDGIVASRAVTCKLVDSIERAGPFGIGSPRPRYALPNQQILRRRKVGTSHLVVNIQDRAGTRIDGFVPDGYSSSLGSFLRKCGRKPVHLAGTVGNPARGRALFNVEDAAPTA